MSPVVIVMLFSYASFLFSYAGTYTGHILSGVLALAGYIFIKKKNYVLSGLMVGLAVGVEYTTGILIPLWAILIYLNEKKYQNLFCFLQEPCLGYYLSYFITCKPQVLCSLLLTVI